MRIEDMKHIGDGIYTSPPRMESGQRGYSFAVTPLVAKTLPPAETQPVTEETPQTLPERPLYPEDLAERWKGQKILQDIYCYLREKLLRFSPRQIPQGGGHDYFNRKVDMRPYGFAESYWEDSRLDRLPIPMEEVLRFEKQYNIEPILEIINDVTPLKKKRGSNTTFNKLAFKEQVKTVFDKDPQRFTHIRGGKKTYNMVQLATELLNKDAVNPGHDTLRGRIKIILPSLPPLST